jgi:hypothetical protein
MMVSGPTLFAAIGQQLPLIGAMSIQPGLLPGPAIVGGG